MNFKTESFRGARGGGGAGGSIYLRGLEVFADDRRVTALGGRAGCGRFGCGGNGGFGRIRIDAGVFNGITVPKAEYVKPYEKTFNVLFEIECINSAMYRLLRILRLWLGNRFQ